MPKVLGPFEGFDVRRDCTIWTTFGGKVGSNRMLSLVSSRLHLGISGSCVWLRPQIPGTTADCALTACKPFTLAGR